MNSPPPHTHTQMWLEIQKSPKKSQYVKLRFYFMDLHHISWIQIGSETFPAKCFESLIPFRAYLEAFFFYFLIICLLFASFFSCLSHLCPFCRCFCCHFCVQFSHSLSALVWWGWHGDHSPPALPTVTWAPPLSRTSPWYLVTFSVFYFKNIMHQCWHSVCIKFMMYMAPPEGAAAERDEECVTAEAQTHNFSYWACSSID